MKRNDFTPKSTTSFEANDSVNGKVEVPYDKLGIGQPVAGPGAVDLIVRLNVGSGVGSVDAVYWVRDGIEYTTNEYDPTKLWIAERTDLGGIQYSGTHIAVPLGNLTNFYTDAANIQGVSTGWGYLSSFSAASTVTVAFIRI